MLHVERVMVMVIERRVKETITPIELEHGDVLKFGGNWEMKLVQTSAEVLSRLPAAMKDGNHYAGDIAVYGMTAVVAINGREHVLKREVGSQASFYEPWEVDGVRVWFDAAACAFIHPPKEGGIIHEKDWAHKQVCRPYRAGRFLVQAADRGIAPEPIGAWYEGQQPVPDIRECYLGADCWMGPYAGGAAHCGLDINMKAGTILTAPIDLDDQYVFNDMRAGIKCGRWRGTRRWADGSDWVIQSHHIVEALVPEKTPLKRGAKYARGAGTAVGAREHSHFMWRIVEQGGDYLVDPWILFWAAGRKG